MKKILFSSENNNIMTTRLLTKKEINDIVSFLKPNPKLPLDVADGLVNIHKQDIIQQLQDVEIYPEMIPELKKQIEETYYDSTVEAGESVGVIMAQSIGEKQTQSRLNNFHTAGSSDNARINVVSTFAELLNATKSPKAPMCRVYFNNGNSTIPELRKTIGHSIVEITIKNITKEWKVFIGKKQESWYEAFNILYPQNIDFTPKDCLVIKIDMDILYTYKITMKEIADDIQANYHSVFVMFSPEPIGELHVYVNTSTDDIELPENRISYVTTENAAEIYLEEVVYPILSEKTICGAQGISNMYFARDGDKWMIETDGSNITHLLSLSHIDPTKTITTNLWDIYQIFGIEAARQFLIDSFLNIMGGILVCQPTLLADKMTFTGTIHSVSRYTMRKEESATLQKISFEETLDNCLESATFGRLEPTIGVSASIICGKRSRIGTGICDVKMDLEKLMSMKISTNTKNDDDDDMPDDSDSENDN